MVSVTYDIFPYDIRWSLYHVEAQEVVFGTGFNQQYEASVTIDTLVDNLAEGTYTFLIEDNSAQKNGMADGSVQITENGVVVLDFDGVFGAAYAVDFQLPFFIDAN